MRHFSALWRRSHAFKGLVVLVASLSLLLTALSLQPGGWPHGAASPPSVAQSRFTTPAPRSVAIGQLPGAAAPSAPASSAARVVAPSPPDASIAPRAGTASDAATLVGKTVTGNVVAKGKSVPLQPGQWIVVAHFPAPDPGGVESLFLAQARRDKLARAVLVQASTQPGESATGFRRSAHCAPTALLYAKTVSNEEFGRQDCWTIAHSLSTRSERDTPPIIRAAIGDLELRGVKYPPVLLSVFFRLADQQSFLHAVYYFNPETDGIASKPAIWEESEWNRNYIHKYPDKIAYVEKLRAWAEAWHAAVGDGFQGVGLAQPGPAGTARKP